MEPLPKDDSTAASANANLPQPQTALTKTPTDPKGDSKQHLSMKSPESPSEEDTSHNVLTTDSVVDEKPADLEAQKADTKDHDPVYSIYTRRQKNFIVLMSCLGGLFSPFSSSSILPALDVLASTYSVPLSLINLSVTVFMIVQGIAPSIYGDLADMAGRRPVYLISFVFVIVANLALALQSSYAGFLVLRCLQSAGSSGMYSLNSGIVADISTTAERGKYMGAAQSGIMLGPALSPVLGGILAEYLGYRAIFWFLVIAGGVYIVTLGIFVPETARKIVGNGSIPPTAWWNRSVLNEFARRREARKWTANETKEKQEEAKLLASKRKLRLPKPFKTLRIIGEKDCACIMLMTAIVYASWYTLTTTLATEVRAIYGLNVVDAGLCYLPFGAGAAIATFLNGRVLDWNYARVARAKNLPINKKKGDDLSKFPIEQARLELVWPQLYLGCASLISFGWTLEAQTSLAAPLVMSFLVGLFMTTTYNSLNVLLVDLYPDSPSTASAANNLTRCSMGAGGSAVIQPMIARLGLGWAFTLTGLVVVVFSPLFWVVRRWGPGWREERRLRILERKSRK